MDQQPFSDTTVPAVQTTPLSSVSTITLPINSVRCEGRHLERPYRHRWMNWPHKRRSFHDPEYNCYFISSDNDDHGLEIGHTNEGDSHFNITLMQGSDTDPGKVTFSVEFGSDPTVKARFESAVIRIEFGYDGDVDGRSFPLRIKDIHPKDDKGQAARVRGQGIHSSSAQWTFVEDVGEAGQQGLDPHYELFATLPTTQQIIWIKCWGRAILKQKDGFGWGNEVILELGSKEEPYRRNIDLLGWQALMK
ncbi:uncharacterized protein BT62DRAFT_543796 [Guyanagaster necrorhizus]|uniref:Uncharacterized protein n=1 Tax=Guyanagaster necrorhizus TaxID=856835 RepID=A0A9P7W1Z2_9AGAR|nr:uncharacterized protein BT62DRAFT_543796 [Guyanagaster necrorhizus MCA 3950]KAG7450910.1 hypothetical protein BT62DRAFT_543796 [Guyanagaster necrorhizus MCA 3950]